MGKDFSKKDFMDLCSAMKLVNTYERKREEKEKKAHEKGKILCLGCEAIVRIPRNKKSGYGTVFTCPYCGAKYFAEMPADALETIQEIAESAGKSVEEIEIKKVENFDTLKDRQEDKNGDVYNLYFVLY